MPFFIAISSLTLLSLVLTLIIVKRDRYKAVTKDFRLPVLIRSTPEDQEGVATFEPEFGPPKPVRTFKNSDLKNARKHLGESDLLHFNAVVALIQALKEPSDSIALQKAKDAFDKSYSVRQAEPSKFSLQDPTDERFAKVLSRHICVPPEEAIEVFEGKRPGPLAAADHRRLLSYAVSEALFMDSRLVLWWTGSCFMPAIWCDDVKTAFYVRALLEAAGGKGLHMCPHCSQPFFQDRPNQNYCSIAHREAHRVARWRAAHPKNSIKKGGKNVSRKTR